MGFNLTGVLRAAPSPRLDAYERWLADGMHGTMGYLARSDRVARRRDLNAIVPGVRSIIMVGVDYHSRNLPPDITTDPGRGRIAAYAWGRDYHDVLTPRLMDLAVWLAQTAGHAPSQRVYVDTGAILERSHAQQAGLGFIGKNTMLIHPQRGSTFFLGEILTTLEFDAYDTPHREAMCGTCDRCRAACPTGAFPQPYVLDARRCISYLTIEHKGWIPADLRPSMGNWIMGCDVCQDVCPFNRFAVPTRESAFMEDDINRIAPRLLNVLTLDETSFKARYGGTPVARLTRERLVRNACIAAGNWRSDETADALCRLLTDPSPLLRGHAAWALGRLPISGAAVRQAIGAALARETDMQVRAELHMVM